MLKCYNTAIITPKIQFCIEFIQNSDILLKMTQKRNITLLLREYLSLNLVIL